MLPVIALVGRPNVGKSTLFNRLTRTRDALVADQPGLTRDRQYGVGRLGPSPYIVIDTGGLSGVREGLDPLMENQVMQAIEEADHLLFLVDGREGRNASDEGIAERLRRTGKPVTLVVNKSENLDQHIAATDFYGLTSNEPVAIAAAHGRGVKPLIEDVLSTLPPATLPEEEDDRIRIAVVGRPNVGKSTLINRLIGEERVVAFDMPGTTRDSIDVPFERDGKKYTLIDTAGVRKRGRVKEAIEKFSIVKTLQAIEGSNVVFLLIDAHEGITEQDAHLAGHLLDSGRALVVVVNKWDGLEQGEREHVKTELKRRLQFLDFARWHFVSALHGSGVGNLIESVNKGYANAMRDMKTSRLTEILEDAVMEHQPPMVRGRRIKMRYAHQGGKNPPIIVIHGNQVDSVPATYKRYLVKRFRSVLHLDGTPLRIEFKSGSNPFHGRKNKLTTRQVQKKKRLMKHVKKSK
ncbi:ribosome biogenesis GTPase Der [Solemya velum gill symbiont]|uniref:GTPase Der n=2 Tax=Solemya velum gill symbiont TaxID=2340 RepID=A0A0B0HBU7_SOVGS|nr:ribosome biogenesis GTPase Der [Solemya velum gill symbiont]KHF25344.1 ribosome-associated GTPase EngA [Solemya velum gill symbiont]OOY35120.1 ribosome biogenesis GTPase Der [Solemya velum gill symbiont]OOY37863.1 ribosome biogenesis GTPase Der [Solemya velum gill symbiont]OOY39303.1 ribosome biogenesis GTPase Der [Solemya velum gill symbiont]OOY47086.1 ribosome biogenesis GTPase Der [Solemya velum gill symbiont]